MFPPANPEPNDDIDMRKLDNEFAARYRATRHAAREAHLTGTLCKTFAVSGKYVATCHHQETGEPPRLSFAAWRRAFPDFPFHLQYLYFTKFDALTLPRLLDRRVRLRPVTTAVEADELHDAQALALVFGPAKELPGRFLVCHNAESRVLQQGDYLCRATPSGLFYLQSWKLFLQALSQLWSAVKY